LTLAVLGTLSIGYGAIVFFFGDPITRVYHDWRQRQMAHELDKSFARFRPLIPKQSSGPGPKLLSPAEVRPLARRFSNEIGSGDPIGRIVIASIGVNEIVINGTRWAEDLSRGPGRYPQSSFPGLGEVTAIAGHRTTFGAPFRHIDELTNGDQIRLEMPYATFVYRVFAHEVVRNDDWSILHRRPFETLVLSACHPLYSASHRWIVFARLRIVTAPARERT